MPQFDVHRNRGALRDSIPFVVLVQSSQFDGYRRRVVVPLVLRSALAVGISTQAGARMNPVLKVEGSELVLHPLDMVSVAMDQLGAYVCSLADQGQSITDALDELLTRSWG
nr:CcdB family protein [Rhodoferax sp.]